MTMGGGRTNFNWQWTSFSSSEMWAGGVTACANSAETGGKNLSTRSCRTTTGWRGGRFAAGERIFPRKVARVGCFSFGVERSAF